MVLITRNILLHSVVVEGRKQERERKVLSKGILYVLAGDIAYEGSAVREMEG